MVTRRDEVRTHGQFLANGTTPLVQPFANTMGFVLGGVASYSSVRLRTDIEMYVVAVGAGAANVDFRVFDETIMVVGCLLYTGGSVASSRTPLSDENLPPGVLGLHYGWGQWEYLYPTVDFVNVITPQFAIATWRPKNGTIDTQFRRREDSINGFDLWMPWEIQDGSGLINTTTAGVTYALGVRFAQAWWVTSRT
jgi:hypothetical protein